MKKLSSLFIFLSCLFASCNNDDEPAIVTENNQTFNLYMSQQNVVNHIPEYLSTGDDAPFYLIDKDRQIYMKVITDNGERLAECQECYFKFTTYLLEQSGNNVIPKLSSSTENEIGTQPDKLRYSQQSDIPPLLPLHYVGNWSEVYLAIRQISDKSDTPLLMHIRYYPKDL